MRAPALALLAALLAGPAHAIAQASGATPDCRTPEQVLTGLVVPADGATGVPTNATPFVGGGGGALELKLVGPDGSDIASNIEQIAVGSPFGAQAALKRIVPAGPLTAGQTITVVADGSVLTSFTVGNDAATAAPAAVDAGVGESCPGAGAGVTIDFGASVGDAALVVAVVNGQPQLGGNVTLDAVSDVASGAPITLFGTGTATVNVAGVDLAGNVGASTPVQVTFPTAQDFGCAAAGTPAPLAAALALLGALARRPRAR